MKLFFYLYTCAIIVISFNLVKDIESHQISIFFGLFLSASIIPFIFITRKISIFEPIFWLSIYYYVLIYSEFVTLQTNFNISTFFQNSHFYTDALSLFSKSIWTVLIGYLCFVTSYHLVLNRDIELKGNSYLKGVSFKLLKVISCIFMLIAILNFVYNINEISNLDIIAYYKKISYYSGHLVDFGVTILGYNFMYPSIFFILYLYINNKIKMPTMLIFLLIFLLIESSLGRITGLGMSIITMYLVFLYANNEFFLNIKRLITLSFSMLVIISLFFFRMYSEYNRVFGTNLKQFVSEELNNVTYILIGQGNLPNIGIVMKIIDSWEIDIGFLYGSSIFVGLSVFLPSSLSVNLVQNNTVSWIIKKNWYSDIPGGGLPPTIIGDLFANFGYVGVFTGMLILGYLFARIFNAVIKKKNYFIFVVYAYFLTRFVFILPKGEFSRISVMLIPILIIIVLYSISLLTSVAKKS